LKDSDSDGIPDSVDVDVTGGSDADNDGIDDLADADFVAGEDQDFDGIVDARDPDANGDGFADAGVLISFLVLNKLQIQGRYALAPRAMDSVARLVMALVVRQIPN